MSQTMKKQRFAWACLTAAVFLAGCAKPKVNISAGTSTHIEGFEEAQSRIAAHPIQFLDESLEESKKLTAFTVNFQRQERLGLGAIKELKPQENMHTEYRDEPFSVRFTWTDEESEYAQAVYVQGKNDNKVLLLPRKGFLGQPPKVQAFAPMLGVVFGKTRNPITDFGPRRMMERVLDRIAKAEKNGKVEIKLREPTEIGPAKESCFYLELRYPPGDEFPCKLQDLYISTRTKLPIATYLWLPGKEERTTATLDGMYLYSDLRPTELTDRNFVIDVDRKQALAGAAKPESSESNDASPSAASTSE